LCRGWGTITGPGRVRTRTFDLNFSFLSSFFLRSFALLAYRTILSRRPVRRNLSFEVSRLERRRRRRLSAFGGRLFLAAL
jgi:hypothetical protein